MFNTGCATGINGRCKPRLLALFPPVVVTGCTGTCRPISGLWSPSAIWKLIVCLVPHVLATKFDGAQCWLIRCMGSFLVVARMVFKSTFILGSSGMSESAVIAEPPSSHAPPIQKGILSCTSSPNNGDSGSAHVLQQKMK
jgi:hypothetical protein